MKEKYEIKYTLQKVEAHHTATLFSSLILIGKMYKEGFYEKLADGIYSDEIIL